MLICVIGYNTTTLTTPKNLDQILRGVRLEKSKVQNIIRKVERRQEKNVPEMQSMLLLQRKKLEILEQTCQAVAAADMRFVIRLDEQYKILEHELLHWEQCFGIKILEL